MGGIVHTAYDTVEDLRSLVAAEHLLLRGPTLLIVNKGPFSYRDSYAIHSSSAHNGLSAASGLRMGFLGGTSIWAACITVIRAQRDFVGSRTGGGTGALCAQARILLTSGHS